MLPLRLRRPADEHHPGAARRGRARPALPAGPGPLPGRAGGPEGAGDRGVISRLRSLFAVRFPFDPLTEDQVRTLKGALHREVVVRRRPATAASVPGGQPLLPGAVAPEVLDAQQEQEARSLGSGHHVVFGVAGSGKTVLLLARARLIAERDPGRKVLVLCYNRVLAASLAAQLDEPGLRGIEVRHFLSWAARKTGLRSATTSRSTPTSPGSRRPCSEGPGTSPSPRSTTRS